MLRLKIAFLKNLIIHKNLNQTTVPSQGFKNKTASQRGRGWGGGVGACHW